MWWTYLIAVIVGAFLGMFFVFAAVPSIGTLKVDLKSENENDIARFIFDKPLSEVVKYNVMVVKIQKADNLKSIK